MDTLSDKLRILHKRKTRYVYEGETQKLKWISNNSNTE